MAKKEELKELDLGVINEIIETNSAPDAKGKIQVYAKECGFKISKSNISVDDMVVKLLEMADSKENEKLEYSPMDKIKTPVVLVDVKSIAGDEVEELDIVVEPKGFPLEPGEVVAIQDLKEDIKNEIVDAIQSGDLTLSAPIMDNMLDDGKVGLTAIEPAEHIKDQAKILEENTVRGEPSHVVHFPSGFLMSSKEILETQPMTGDPSGFTIPAVYEGNEPDLSGFTPRINLIGAVGQQYMNCPYWILDWILENGKTWKNKIHEHPRTTDHPILKTVLYYIQINGSVTVRESRNSRFHTLY